MLISEVARPGVAPKTLRYYESIAILGAPDRTTAGYRNYDRPVLKRLAFVCSVRSPAGHETPWPCNAASRCSGGPAGQRLVRGVVRPGALLRW